MSTVDIDLEKENKNCNSNHTSISNNPYNHIFYCYVYDIKKVFRYFLFKVEFTSKILTGCVSTFNKEAEDCIAIFFLKKAV